MAFPTIRILSGTVLAAALLLPASASAESSVRQLPRHVTGSYAVADPGTTACTTLLAAADGAAEALRCTTANMRSTYSGDLQGDVRTDFTTTIDCVAGRAFGHGHEVFTGSLQGRGRGTLRWSVEFGARFDCTSFLPSRFVAVGIVRAGSGALAGARGTLRFDDDSYAGVVR